MATHHPIRKTVTPEIPDKLYFRIGDVARICEVPAYVLRFWETEFPQLKPNKGGTGQRLYRRRDVEMALRIKSLLYDQGYTIPGARQVFKSETRPEARTDPRSAAETRPRDPQAGPSPVARMPGADPAPLDSAHSAALQSLRAELRDLHSLLSAPAATNTRTPRSEGKVQPMRPRLATVESRRTTQLSLEGDLF